MSAVLVGTVWEHPLERSRWKVLQTGPGQVTKLSRVAPGAPQFIWVNTPVLGGTWRPVIGPAPEERP